jgi:hypothetical protein
MEKLMFTETDYKTVKRFLKWKVWADDNEIGTAEELLLPFKNAKFPLDLTEEIDEAIIDTLSIIDNEMYNYVSFSVYADLEEKGVAYVNRLQQDVLLLRTKLALWDGCSWENVEFLKDVRLHIRKNVYLDLYTQLVGYLQN